MRYCNNKEIAILLAAYNGAEYISEQIYSILNQNISNWTLYIRDDGSSDETLRIIDGFVKQNESIILVCDNYDNKGASANFFSLLQLVESKYYMFSDQDDVWLQNKVESAYLRMKKLEIENMNRPIVVGTDLTVVDSHLNIVAKSFWNYSKINISLLGDFNYLAVCNGITGCTMIINDSVKQLILPTLPTSALHDTWIALNVSMKGGLIDYINEASILYRQHSKNLVGSQKVNVLSFFTRIVSLKSVYRQNKELYEVANSVSSYSLMKYFWYKFLYTLKR